jgi:hypothetical protein
MDKTVKGEPGVLAAPTFEPQADIPKNNVVMTGRSNNILKSLKLMKRIIYSPFIKTVRNQL